METEGKNGNRLLVVSYADLLNLEKKPHLSSEVMTETFASYLLELHNCGFQIFGFLAPMNFLERQRENYLGQARTLVGIMNGLRLQKKLIELSEDSSDWIRVATKVMPEHSEPYNKKKVENHLKRRRIVLYVPDPSEFGTNLDGVVRAFCAEIGCNQIVEFPLRLKDSR